MPKPVRTLWEWLGHLALIHWLVTVTAPFLWSIGGSTVLTAIAAWLLRLTPLPAPLVWLFSAGIFLLVAAGILTVLSRHGDPEKPPRDKLATHDSVGIVVTRTPASPGVHVVSRETDSSRADYVIETGGIQPSALRLTVPHVEIIKAEDLPRVVSFGRDGQITIKKFLPTGVLVQEEGTHIGRRITFEVYETASTAVAPRPLADVLSMEHVDHYTGLVTSKPIGRAVGIKVPQRKRRNTRELSGKTRSI